jgi:hypothetical protein
MQITTYGRTAAPIEVIVPVDTTTPEPPNNPGPVLPPSDSTVMLSTVTPVLMDKLKLDVITVQQTAIYDRARKEYYVSQRSNGSNGQLTPYETTNITRCDDTGKALDTMKLLDAGHGTSIVVENYGKKNLVYIWLSFSNQHNTYYRFPYTKGTFKFKDVPNKTKIPQFTAGYFTYHLDWEADSLMERVNNSDTTMTLKKRKISEVLKGVDKVYATIRTQPIRTKQGWAAINDSVYILGGDTNGETLDPPDPTVIDTYSWTTGTKIDSVTLTDLGKEGGLWEDDTHEPEGLSVYRDPTTKKASLLMGVTTGIYIKGSSSHKWFVYRFTDIGKAP